MEASRHLAFDLVELLDVLGPRGRRSTWECRVDELIAQDANDELDVYSSLEVDSVSGTDLHAIARRIRQVIDGKFRGFDSGDPEAWVELCAVDSSLWDVRTTSRELAEEVMRRFQNVESNPPDAV